MRLFFCIPIIIIACQLETTSSEIEKNIYQTEESLFSSRKRAKNIDYRFELIDSIDFNADNFIIEDSFGLFYKEIEPELCLRKIKTSQIVVDSKSLYSFESVDLDNGCALFPNWGDNTATSVCINGVKNLLLDSTNVFYCNKIKRQNGLLYISSMNGFFIFNENSNDPVKKINIGREVGTYDFAFANEYVYIICSDGKVEKTVIMKWDIAKQEVVDTILLPSKIRDNYHKSTFNERHLVFSSFNEVIVINLEKFNVEYSEFHEGLSNIVQNNLVLIDDRLIYFSKFDNLVEVNLVKGTKKSTQLNPDFPIGITAIGNKLVLMKTNLDNQDLAFIKFKNLISVRVNDINDCKFYLINKSYYMLIGKYLFFFKE